MKMIEQLRKQYHAIAEQLSAPPQYVKFTETPQHDGSPHVEYEGNELLYVVTERGTRVEERRTTDPDELLFWLISGLTWQMASDFELSHRIESQDCRRQLFAKHLELLTAVKPEWARRKKQEYDKILVEHPYNDDKG